MDEGYVLAMYDVRGKQEFIYRSTKCKEIVGGSHIIEDVFKDYLFPAAKEYRDENLPCENEAIYSYRENDMWENEKPEAFFHKEFEKRMHGGVYIGEVVYEGGGNFLVLYKNKSVCIDINKRFSRYLLRRLDTLKVLCTCVEIKNFDDYERDQKELYERHRVREVQECVLYPVNTLPFIQISPENGRPFTGMVVKNSRTGEEKATTEQIAKYKKYKEHIINLHQEDIYDKEEFLLDNLVEERGKESLLAVVYIDGNNMRAKVQQCLDDLKNKGKMDYDSCVTRLREFSSDIQKNYVQNRIRAINRKLEEKYEKNPKKARRTIVAAGDEMTIICNARDAFDVIQAYFEGLTEGSTSCAGVAIFHSHAPYADAYRIAEECCENGKTQMKEAQEDSVNLMDFHYCQGGIGIDLEHIRKREAGGELYSRPWRIEKAQNPGSGNIISPCYGKEAMKENVYRDAVNKMVCELQKLGRSNVKALRQAAEMGKSDFKMEQKRINAHRKPGELIDFGLNGKLNDEAQRKLIYDISIIYDLWFGKRTEGEGNE